MSEVLFAGDIVEAAEVPQQTITEWSMKGVISPANSGRGTGRHRTIRCLECDGIEGQSELLPGPPWDRKHHVDRLSKCTGGVGRPAA